MIGSPPNKIFVTAYVPAFLREAWMQHLRDFDEEHPECHFEVLVHAPQTRLSELLEGLRNLSPQFKDVVLGEIMGKRETDEH